MKTQGMLKHNIIQAAAILLLGGALAISAQAQTWTGNAGTSEWSTPGNWSSGTTIPTGTDAVTINPTAENVGNPFPVISDGYWAAQSLVVNGGTLIGSGTLTLNNTGTLVVGSVGNTRIGAGAGHKGYLVVTDNAYISFAAANMDFGYQGTGYADISGNAVMENLGGGYVLIAESGASAGFVTIRENATWNVASASLQAIYVGYGASGGGNLTIKDSARVNVANGGVNLGRTAAALGTLTLSSTNAANRATLSTFTGIETAAAALAANSKLIFDGGVLQARTGYANFIRGNITMTTMGDGAFIDSNGFNIGIANTVIIRGTGGLTKLGGGTLTLNTTATNTTYTGSTAITAGSLILTSTNQLATSGAVFVGADASLSALNLNQTLNNISGSGNIDLGTGKLIAINNGDTVFDGAINAQGGFEKRGAGTLVLASDNSVSFGVDPITLAGGVLGVAHEYAIGVNDVLITGGTLRADVTTELTNSVRSQGVALNVGASTGASLKLTGVVTGSLGLVKTGAGNVTLSNTNSVISGVVNVINGGLFVEGLSPTSVAIANGASFGSTGNLNCNIIYANSGALQVGITHFDALVTTPVTLTIDDLSTGGNLLMKFDIYDGASDKLVADNITIGGALNMDFSSLRMGQFTLIDVVSGTLDSALIDAIVTSRNGVTASARELLAYSLTPDAKTLQVAISKTNTSLTWTGVGGNMWDYNSTASWAGTDNYFVDGDKVTFAATGSHSIEIHHTSVAASEMLITGNGDYTFTGEGRISTDALSSGDQDAGFGGAASGKFIKQGTGTVIFENTSNVFAGGIDVQQGTVIGNADTLGKNATITNSGTVLFHQENNTSFVGSLHGNGYFAKTGVGTLTFTAADSTATGTFDVREGSLLLATGAKLSDVDIDDGATFGGGGIAEIVRAHGGATVRVGAAVGGAEVGTETLALRALSLGNNTRIIGAGTLATNATIENGATAIAEIAENREVALVGTLSGNGGFTKQGPGGFVLTQAATYAGNTTIEAGYLRAGGPGLLSSNSFYTIKAAGSLQLNGHDHTLRSIVNAGNITIGGSNTVGTRLTIQNGYTGAAGSTIGMNLRATDTADTMVDQIIIQGGEITGRTLIRVNVTDLRANPGAYESYLTDIPALIINEAGDMPQKVFTITDGTSSNRVVIGSHDYRIYTYQNEVRLIASDSAEVPAVLAINPISIAVNRATLNSIGQRLDRLHDLQTAADNKDRDKGIWLQGYYRRDRFYDQNWATTNGVQVGFDIPADTSRSGTVIYGLFADYTNSKIEIASLFNNPFVKLDSKSLGAYLALQHDAWGVDFVAKYTWDDYTINVIDTPEFDTTGASWGGFARLSYTAALKNGWTLVPQAQLIFQARGVDDVRDAYGRTYTFGQKYARIDEANSLESRLSISARKLITLKNGKVLHPWITFGYNHDFKGDMTVTTLNSNGFPVSMEPYRDDLGGSSFQLSAGLSAQLSNRFSAILEGTLQNGGKVDSYSINAGLNCRW